SIHRFGVGARQIFVQRIVKRRARGRIDALRPFEPASAGGMPARTGLAPLLEHGFWNLERLVRPVQCIAGLCDLVSAKRRAMGLFATLAVRRPETDQRAA